MSLAFPYHTFLPSESTKNSIEITNTCSDFSLPASLPVSFPVCQPAVMLPYFMGQDASSGPQNAVLANTSGVPPIPSDLVEEQALQELGWKCLGKDVPTQFQILQQSDFAKLSQDFLVKALSRLSIEYAEEFSEYIKCLAHFKEISLLSDYTYFLSSIKGVDTIRLFDMLGKKKSKISDICAKTDRAITRGVRWWQQISQMEQPQSADGDSKEKEHKYHQLKIWERYYIWLRRRHPMVRQKDIAKELNRNPATISREVRRLDRGSYGPSAKYDWKEAQADRDIKRNLGGWKGKHTLKNEKGEYVTTVIRRAILEKKFSPEQIAHRVLQEPGQVPISTATTYRWINAGVIYDISRKDLRRQGKKQKKSYNYTNKYAKGRCISERPEEINSRRTFGHFEADSIVSPRTGSGRIFTLVERRTRYVLAKVVTEGTAKNFVKFIKEVLRKYGRIIKSITVDRGSEFACWEELEAMGIAIYFCHPYNPNEKGQIEHMNGELRWFFPKNTDFSQISPTELYNKGIRVLNGWPREILGWRTAKEAFEHELSLQATASA